MDTADKDGRYRKEGSWMYMYAYIHLRIHVNIVIWSRVDGREDHFKTRMHISFIWFRATVYSGQAY